MVLFSFKYDQKEIILNNKKFYPESYHILDKVSETTSIIISNGDLIDDNLNIIGKIYFDSNQINNETIVSATLILDKLNFSELNSGSYKISYNQSKLIEHKEFTCKFVEGTGIFLNLTGYVVIKMNEDETNPYISIYTKTDDVNNIEKEIQEINNSLKNIEKILFTLTINGNLLNSVINENTNALIDLQKREDENSLLNKLIFDKCVNIFNIDNINNSKLDNIYEISNYIYNKL